MELISFQHLFFLFRGRRFELGYLAESVEFQGCPNALDQLCPGEASPGIAEVFAGGIGKGAVVERKGCLLTDKPFPDGSDFNFILYDGFVIPCYYRTCGD